jgi:hypothetical protein
MGVLGRIFGSDKALESIGGIIDGAHYSGEEKAEHKQKLLALYEPFKLAQRYLALIVGIPYVTLCVIAGLLFASSVFFDPCTVDTACKSFQIKDTAKELFTYTNQSLGPKFLMILTFYFGGGFLEGVIGKAKKRNKKTEPDKQND